MTKACYMIKGMGPAFDGIVIECDSAFIKHNDLELFKTNRLINRSSVFGDRNITYQVPDGSLWISNKYLEKTEDPATREFSSTNPLGKCEFEGRYSRGNIEIVYAQYEHALQFSVLEKLNKKTKTIYSDYIRNGFQKMKNVIEDCLKDGSDPDDIIFAIMATKEQLEKENA